jgi:hypothetical protein
MALMKHTFLGAIVAALLLAATAGSAHATEVGYGRKLGIGFVLGDPTGLSGKYWVGSTNAVDVGLGFASYGSGFGASCYYDDRNVRRCYGYFDTSLNVDYLWQSNIVRGPAQLDWYIGAGGRVLIFGGRGFDIAARAPIGLALMFNNPSFLEVFFELVPALYLAPPNFTIEGGLGVRFYF